MKTIIGIFGLLAFLLTFAGCNEPHPPSQPPRESLVIDKGDLDAAWDETVEVLREHYFIPDRQDRRAGLIITCPTLSKQWFEFWRDDTQGMYEVAESSIQSTRRTVQVRFLPAGAKYEIQVSVRVQRKNQPERQMTTSSSVAMVARDKAPATTGQMIERSQDVTWVDIGDDVRLANYLLQRVERRLPQAEEKPRELSVQ